MSVKTNVTYVPTELIPTYLDYYWHIVDARMKFYPLGVYCMLNGTSVLIFEIQNLKQYSDVKPKSLSNVTDLTLRREDQYSQDYTQATYCFVLGCLSKGTQHTITITNTVHAPDYIKNTLSVEHKEHKKEEAKKEET